MVVPAYNEEGYIDNCLESLMQQEITPDEILVINNNSTDRTVAIAKKFPVRIVNEKEQGTIQARNRGFNEAQYDIIARTDADTIVPSDWIKKIKKSFQDKKLIALSGPSYYYDLPEVVQTSEWPSKAAFQSYAGILKQILRHDCLYGPNMALRKSSWEKVKEQVCLNNKDVHEDVDLAVHLAPLGKIIFDYDLVVRSSFRRFKKFKPYFEYPYRMFKGFSKHKITNMKQNGTKLVKKIVAKAFSPMETYKNE